ncbi:MAG: 2-oxoacid:acceptor oxidoreductase subunit alpha [bacterium]|nr:2-oxoacid:acceptor oxidoreductase subunit alpha [bacterium]
MTDFSLLIGGEAGFGIMTTGAIFSRIATRLGYHIFDYVIYPSLIRGGHNAYEVHVTEDKNQFLKATYDYIICLNKETFEKHKQELTNESYVIYDPDEFIVEGNFKQIQVPFKQILKKLDGQVIMKNTISLGAILALLGSDMNVLKAILEKQFEKKGESIIQFNQKFAEEGYNHVISNYKNEIKLLLIKKDTGEKLVISGNEAFSLGAAIADCRVYVAYPMTPASSVQTTLAAWQEKSGMIVRHAEDEISVINTALGASFAGSRAAVGTSGGGFALMVESISYAGIAEIPIVIFLAQRPGPATGMPTWTEQGDLLFAVHAGHGEFPKIVLAPGDVGEMVDLTAQAFNLADIYQTSVLVLSDMLLSESHTSLDKSFVDGIISQYKVNRGKTVSTPSEKPYLRYKITEDGISERLIPGYKGVYYQANSYEHLEDGHTSEEAETRIQQVNKRARKLTQYLKNDFKGPSLYGDLLNAELVFVSWGANKGVILKAQEELIKKNIKTAFLQFTHVYPLSKEAICPFFNDKSKKFVLIENNSTGQFGQLLRMETGVDIEEKILRYDGRAITVEEIISKVNELN